MNFLSLIAVEAFHPQLSHVVRMSWEYSVEVTVMLLLSIAHKNVHAGAFGNLLVGFVKANVCAVCCGSAIFHQSCYVCLYCNLQCHCFLVIVNAVVW